MRRALLALLTLAPIPAMACDGELLMSCTARGGARVVEACLLDEAITYSYGKPRQVPEISLFEPLASGTYYPWEGFGRYINESLTFLNADYSYRVWTSVDKLSDLPMEGGVTVMQADTVVAEIACDPGSVTGLIDLTYDAMAARGYCWNPQEIGWENCN